jgi:hypothetical protein
MTFVRPDFAAEGEIVRMKEATDLGPRRWIRPPSGSWINTTRSYWNDFHGSMKQSPVSSL